MNLTVLTLTKLTAVQHMIDWFLLDPYRSLEEYTQSSWLNERDKLISKNILLSKISEDIWESVFDNESTNFHTSKGSQVMSLKPRNSYYANQFVSWSSKSMNRGFSLPWITIRVENTFSSFHLT